MRTRTRISYGLLLDRLLVWQVCTSTWAWRRRKPPWGARTSPARVARPVPPPSPSPDFVPGLPHVMIIELRQVHFSYQDYSMLLLSLAGPEECAAQDGGTERAHERRDSHLDRDPVAGARKSRQAAGVRRCEKTTPRAASFSLATLSFSSYSHLAAHDAFSHPKAFES